MPEYMANMGVNREVGGNTRNVSYGGGDTYSDNYNIMGPVNVNANNPSDFGREMNMYMKRLERAKI